ncbi:UNVERIFIED_CONTAM: hypothetical protein FKN15_064570 [Acipenser sinensis]
MVAACVGAPTTQRMDFKELIEMINRNTVAQIEQTKKWRQELGLPDPEPTELELLLQKWASYFICHDSKTIKQLFERLRNFEGENTYPKTCGSFEVSGVRDLTTGYDSSQADKKAVLPTSKSSQMITFTFSNGGVATMRTSGTEPKIKYYTELCAPPGNSDPEQLKTELSSLVDAIVEHFFEPQKNNLKPQPE